MKLSIVILTWNSMKFVDNCLGSLYCNMGIKDFEVIIIDNGSSDNTLSTIVRKYPDTVLIKNSINKGVAPARNQGISIASGEYILILDIDTYIYPETIKNMIRYMEENADTGICAPKLIFSNGDLQKSCRKFPLLHMKLLRRIDTNWAKSILESENYMEYLNGNVPFEVDYVIGACQLIRKSAMEKIGLLDEKIFYGPEDVDYCLRMWLNGYKVKFLPYLKIIHYEQRITKNKIFSSVTIKHIAGLIYYFNKYKYCFSRRKIYEKINRNK